MSPLKIKISYCAQFGPDNKTCVVIGRNLVLWDIETRKKIWEVKPFTHLSNCSFSPNGELIAVKNTSGNIAIIDRFSGKINEEFNIKPKGEGSNIVFSSDGKQLIDGSWSGLLEIREVSTGIVCWQKQFSNEMVRRISHINDLLITEHQPKTTELANYPENAYFLKWVWPINNSSPKRLLFDFPFLYFSSLNPSGNHLAVVSGIKGTIENQLSVIDIESSRVIWTIPVVFGTGCNLCWSPNGEYLASVQKEGFDFYNGSDGTLAGQHQMEYPSGVAFSSDCSLIACCSWKEGLIIPFERVILKI